MAFLAKIPPYITWPEQGPQLVIGILGKDPFNGVLHQLVKNKKVENRELTVKVFADPAEPIKCDILFIPADQLPAWQERRLKTETRGLLTISEKKDFLESGGVFNLAIAERKLEIKLENVKKAGLEVNSKLLKIAKVYK